MTLNEPLTRHPATTQRWALSLEYDGHCFHGWQSQIPRQLPQEAQEPSPSIRRPSGPSTLRQAQGERPERQRTTLPTVQDALEAALGQIAAQPVAVICAGRTDAGVHATGQVVHFDTTATRPESAWVRGVNAHLPPACAVRWARPVSANFHARFSATARHYRYLLLNRPERPGVLAGRVGWFHRPLDASLMQEAAHAIIGTHDFSAFRAAECQASSPVRTVFEARVVRRGDWLVFDFAANAFLQHMIRNLVGALVHIGKGAATASLMGELLAQQDRSLAPPTFMPDGLYLNGVDYDSTLGLPDTRNAPGDPLQIFSL